ncbi:MAG: serine/threonine-protein kinase [Chitinispirillaceae bacterium]
MKTRLPKGFSLPMKTGGGAFATVYRMRQDALDRWVAVKVIYEKEHGRRKKLLKEATVQARLSIPCIPQVYDAFECGKHVYIIMEWIKGVSLARLLDQAQLSDIQRIWLVDGIICAISTLHTQGFAHRDIKPANILVSPHNGIYLIDFGFTKDMYSGEQSMAGLVKGTPAYMAPELWKGAPDTDYVRADVFSTGKVIDTLLERHPLSAITADMLIDDPARRLANGVEVYKRWDNLRKPVITPQWNKLVGVITAQVHADNLYEASRLLLSRGRLDEAYWLLVECLEENPNFEQALALMANYHHHTRKKKFHTQLRLSIAAAAVVALVLTSFLIGRISSKGPMAEADRLSEGPKQTLHLKAQRGLEKSTDFVFRQDSLETGLLSGRLFISSHPDNGFLVIDEVAYRDVNRLKDGLSLSYGVHVVEWQSQNGTRIWREKMNILPFQAKNIVILPSQKELQG